MFRRALEVSRGGLSHATSPAASSIELKCRSPTTNPLSNGGIGVDFPEGGAAEARAMNLLLLLPLAIPFGCLALLSLLAFLGVLAVAGALQVVGAIRAALGMARRGSWHGATPGDVWR